MRKKLKIIQFILITFMGISTYSAVHAAPNLSVTPLNGQQQTVEHFYANGLEQVPLKVTIHYDTYLGDNINSQYFRNLRFNVGDILTTTKPISPNIVCTPNQYQRLSINTATDQTGQVIFNSRNIDDQLLWLAKSKVWLTNPQYPQVSFCFTDQKNATSSGTYDFPAKATRGLTGSAMCSTTVTRNCDMSHVYYLQVDDRTSRKFLGQQSVGANTQEDDGSEQLSSGNAKENISIDNLEKSYYPLTFTTTAVSGSASYQDMIKVTVSGIPATILFGGIDIDAAKLGTGPHDWTIGWHMGWYTSAHEGSGIKVDTNALINCGPGDQQMCLHNAALGNTNDTKFHGHAGAHNSNGITRINGAYDTTLMRAKEMADYAYASVSFSNFNLDSSGKPQGGQYLYLGTDDRSYDPLNLVFRFYVLDTYGNFYNVDYMPTISR